MAMNRQYHLLERARKGPKSSAPAPQEEGIARKRLIDRGLMEYPNAVGQLRPAVRFAKGKMKGEGSISNS